MFCWLNHSIKRPNRRDEEKKLISQSHRCKKLFDELQAYFTIAGVHENVSSRICPLRIGQSRKIIQTHGIHLYMHAAYNQNLSESLKTGKTLYICGDVAIWKNLLVSQQNRSIMQVRRKSMFANYNTSKFFPIPKHFCIRKNNNNSFLMILWCKYVVCNQL